MHMDNFPFILFHAILLLMTKKNVLWGAQLLKCSKKRKKPWAWKQWNEWCIVLISQKDDIYNQIKSKRKQTYCFQNPLFFFFSYLPFLTEKKILKAKKQKSVSMVWSFFHFVIWRISSCLCSSQHFKKKNIFTQGFGQHRSVLSSLFTSITV